MGFLEVPFALWFSQAKLLLEFIVVLWGVAIVDLGLLNSGLRCAVQKRVRSLGGFFYYPFSGLFHADWDHITGNTLGILLFGGIIVFRDPSQLWMVTIVTALGSGWGVWLFSRARYCCGASGVLFGYLGFIITSASIEKDFSSAIILTWLVFSFLFGSSAYFHNSSVWNKEGNTALVNRLVWGAGKSFWGIVPGENEQISWKAHLFGLLSGVFAAQYKTILTPWVNQFVAWVQQIRV